MGSSPSGGVGSKTWTTHSEIVSTSVWACNGRWISSGAHRNCNCATRSRRAGCARRLFEPRLPDRFDSGTERNATGNSSSRTDCTLSPLGARRRAAEPRITKRRRARCNSVSKTKSSAS